MTEELNKGGHSVLVALSCCLQGSSKGKGKTGLNPPGVLSTMCLLTLKEHLAAMGMQFGLQRGLSSLADACSSR